jgi:hypothetical protein
MVVYRFCKLEDNFGTAEEREIAVLCDDQLSNSTPETPSKIESKLFALILCGPQFIAGSVLLMKKSQSEIKMTEKRISRHGHPNKFNSDPDPADDKLNKILVQ